MDDATPTSVYQYYDAGGRILYVGVTARNVRRAQEHAETKTWWLQTTGCAIEHFASRSAALEREEELIKRYAPPFNTVHNIHKSESLAAYLRLFDSSVEAPGAMRTNVPLGSLTERRRQWYRLSADDKRSAPCVTCGQRPGTRGPQCIVCHPSRSKVVRQLTAQ